MAMSDNPQYAHATAVNHHVKQSKPGQLKQLKQHKGNELPEQMELLALSSDSCSTYPPERTSPSLSATVLSPTNNSVFNYNQPINQQQQQQRQQKQRNIIYQANNQVHLHSQQQPNGISPQIIQQNSINPNLHVAQQLSPPHTLHPNQQMSTQLQHAVQQQKQRYQQQQQQPQLVQQQQPIYNQSISPNSTIPSEPVELIKVLSQALVGQHNQLHQQQQVNHHQHLFSLQQQQQQQAAAQQQVPSRPVTQLNQMHQNDLLKRRLNRWERLTNQNRNYLLSLNNKEDQFRAICALSLLAVPEPQY